MADSPALDPLYVAARRVLLDALTLLAPRPASPRLSIQQRNSAPPGGAG